MRNFSYLIFHTVDDEGKNILLIYATFVQGAPSGLGLHFVDFDFIVRLPAQVEVVTLSFIDDVERSGFFLRSMNQVSGIMKAFKKCVENGDAILNGSLIFDTNLQHHFLSS